jgi:hypothetical protein
LKLADFRHNGLHFRHLTNSSKLSDLDIVMLVLIWWFSLASSFHEMRVPLVFGFA